MKIMVVGSSRNTFFRLDNIRKAFFINEHHDDDNIDFLNPWYCEITGLYYLWKHSEGEDIVGLEHYRRTFGLNEAAIRNELLTCDALCHDTNPRRKGNGSVGGWLTSGWGYGSCEDVTTKVLCVIKLLYPEYLPAVTECLTHNWHWQFNMIITKKEILDKYCEWLFNILNTLITVYKPTSLPPRSVGYVVELLLSNVWLLHNKINVRDKAVRQFNFSKIGYK